MAAVSVVVEKLTRRFGETIAVDDISFRVSKGELFGFIGPDGAGKTTLLQIMGSVCSATPPAIRR